LSQKTPFFAEFFGENSFKNHNIGPSSYGSLTIKLKLVQEQSFVLRAGLRKNVWTMQIIHSAVGPCMAASLTIHA
jgi:hypothetical protein